MGNITNYWKMLGDEQQTVTKEVQQHIDEPGRVPTQHTLQNALNAGEEGCEFASCACMVFIIVVQDREDLGGGYHVQLTALGQVYHKFFEDPLTKIDEVEKWLDANAPYTAYSPVWVPLPTYDSHKHEAEYLKKLWP